MASSGTVTTSRFISQDLVKWCQKNKVQLKDGSLAEPGDVVICSDQGSDFESPCDLGRVLEVCKAGKELVGKKGKPHPDGDVGFIFVLSYKKQKKGRQPIEKQEGWWAPEECFVTPIEGQKLASKIEVL